ncbi:MAG: hypothetical protein MR355_06925 [Lachnospiraceae bacterium]|nr:hypothetical protein [Lachnospiraceae bacterium]
MNQEKKQEMIEKIEVLMQENHGVVKAEKLYPLGLTYRQIQGLVQKGILDHVKNGYYSMHLQQRSEDELILAMFPDGILTMDTALFYHGYCGERPEEWSIAISKNVSKSRFKVEQPVICPYYTEPEVLQMGVEKIPFAQGEIGIYSKERLICDCLKYEERLDRVIMKTALMAYINEPDKDIAALMEYARVRKVTAKVQSRIGVWL